MEAKVALGRIVKEASDGPQLITLRGTPMAVIISVEEYERLTHSKSVSEPKSSTPKNK